MAQKDARSIPPVLMRAIRTVLVVGLLSCGCGSGSPTNPSPAPVASLTGNWAGTFTPAGGTDPQPQRVTASFSQNQQAVSGDLRIDASPVAPPIRLTLDGMLTGTQLTATVRWGGCGSGATSGSLVDGVLRLKIPVLESSSCTFFIDGEVFLQR
jgi:hypothetical protein